MWRNHPIVRQWLCTKWLPISKVIPLYFYLSLSCLYKLEGGYYFAQTLCYPLWHFQGRLLFRSNIVPLQLLFKGGLYLRSYGSNWIVEKRQSSKLCVYNFYSLRVTCTFYLESGQQECTTIPKSYYTFTCAVHIT